MIWDNFSIFRTNCAILASYIRADPCTCRWLSRGCCWVAWSKWRVWQESLADFSQRWQKKRQGIRSRALTCSCMPWANVKGEFFRVEENVALWMNMIFSHSQKKKKVERAGFCLCSRKVIKENCSGIELIWEFPKQCLTITKTYFDSLLSLRLFALASLLKFLSSSFA